MRTANYPTSESIPTANCLAVTGIERMGGGGNSLIYNDIEECENNVSPRAVSTTDTARGLFAFRSYCAAKKLGFSSDNAFSSRSSFVFDKNRPTASRKRNVRQKTGLFRRAVGEFFWRQCFFVAQ